MRKQTTLHMVYLSESAYAMPFTFIYHDEKEKHETAERSSQLFGCILF